LNGERVNNEIKSGHQFKNEIGGSSSELQPLEELQTTGVTGYKVKGKITENDLRKENGKKERVSYDNRAAEQKD